MVFEPHSFRAKSGATLLACLTACVLGGGLMAQMRSALQLKATPTSGAAPLTVTFMGTGSGQLEGVMLLDFGDGHSDDSIPTIRGFERVHTYKAPGIYKVELRSGSYGGQRPAILTTVATVTISVR